MPLRIGITGGIGSGKTMVCQVLEKLGYYVFYSDRVARDISISNQHVISRIKSTFGDEVYVNEQLNRAYLASLVFTNPELLAKLNHIIHPAVARAFEEWCNLYNLEKILFKESAIIFETGLHKQLHKVILVTAPVEVRIRRVMERDGITEQEVRIRMGNQMPEEKKIELADFIIVNDSKTLLLPQLINIISNLLA